MSEVAFIENYALKKLHTMGIDVMARFLVEVSDNQSLKKALIWAGMRDLSVTILGGGSNVLFKGNYDGLIISNALKGIELLRETQTEVWVKSAAGEVWHDFVLYCIEHGWAGIENLSLIPGSVGAAPMQNIGAYGVEIKDVFWELEALNRDTLEVEIFHAEACKFGYRESVFKNELKGCYVILSVIFKLSKEPMPNTSYGAIKEVLNRNGIVKPSIRDVSDAVIEIRQNKLPDPNKIGNAGSFFKNPIVEKEKFVSLNNEYLNMPAYPQLNGDIKLAAGWLIEKCGWKGKRIGDVGVHANQALVLVNYGKGTGQEIKELSDRVKDSVKEKFDIILQEEVNII